MKNESPVQTGLRALLKTFPAYQYTAFESDHFFDGTILVCLLECAGIEITKFKGPKWTDWLKTMHSMRETVEDYFAKQFEKGLVTIDINHTQLVRDRSIAELTKFVQVVFAVLMNAPETKETIINKILTLPAEHQQMFVPLIDNAIHKRVCEQIQTEQAKLVHNLNTLEDEKLVLREEIDNLMKTNHHLEERIEQYESQMEQMQAELEKNHRVKMDQSIEDMAHQNTQYQQVISSLKQRIINSTRQFENEMSSLREENNTLKERVQQLEQAEEMIEVYKEKYEEAVNYMDKITVWERDKAKMRRQVDEKELIIRKLNEKVEEMTDRNLILEETELNLRITLEKREVKFKELQRELKNDLNSQESSVLNNHSSLVNKENIRLELNRQQEEEMAQNLKELDRKVKDLTRENIKLQKRAEQTRVLEHEKRKLQELLIDQQARASEELNLIVGALYESRKEYAQKFKTFMKQ